MADYKDVLLETLEKIANKHEYENFEIEILRLSSEGANFTSSIYKAIITSSNHEKIVLFAKTATMSKEIRERINLDSFFYNESYFYQNMVPILEKIQTKYKFIPEDRFVFPKFYGSNLRKNDETLVLEDLVEQGYTVYDRFKSLDWDTASRAVEQIAKFHALSFAYKEKYTDLYAKEYPLFSKMAKAYRACGTDFQKTGEALYEAVTDDMKPRLRKVLDQFLTEECCEYYYAPGKWKILVHGDYRASNLMYKLENGKLSRLIPVDYQTLHLGSPSTDLIYLIYSGTDEEIRKKYLEDLKDLYYNTLAIWLRQMELNPEEIFSRKDFDEDFTDMLCHGLSTALFILPVVLADSKNAPKVDTKDAGFGITPNNLFFERFYPIFAEYSNLGLI